MEIAQQLLYGLLPSIGIGILFYKIMKLLMESDRKERAAYRHWLAEHDAQADPHGASSAFRAREEHDGRPEHEGGVAR